MASEQQKTSMAETLLEQGQPLIQPPPEDSNKGGAWPPSPLTIVGFAFLTFNSAMAVSSWRSGFGAVSFVAFSYLDLAMLFYCLRMYHKIPPGSPLRERLKVAMWLLTTTLTIAFFQLLEFWFQSMGTAENSTKIQSDPTCPRQLPYSPTVP